MAYAGGIYTKPVSANTDKLAQFYLQGALEVNKIKMQVAEQRGKERASLAKAQADITATGIAEMDKIYHSYADQSRSHLAELEYLQSIGQVSKDEVSRQYANLTSQTGQVAKTVEIFNKKQEKVDEMVGKKEWSIATKNALMRGWLYPQAGFESITLEDGTKIPARRTLSLNKDNNGNFSYVTNQAVSVNGKQEIVTIARPVTQMVDPSIDVYQHFDKTKHVQNWNKRIGNKLIPNYDQRVRAGDTTIWTSFIETGKLPDIVRSMERDIKSFVQDDRNVISLLSDEFGASALGDISNKGIKSQEYLQDFFGELRMSDGSVLPFFYDENGDKLQLSKDSDGNIIDPFILNLDENEHYQVTDDQRKIAAAFLRDEYLKSMDVKYKDFRIRDRVETKDDTPTDFFGIRSGVEGKDYFNSAYLAQALSSKAKPETLGGIRTAIQQNHQYNPLTDESMQIDSQLNTTLQRIKDQNIRPITLPLEFSKDAVEAFNFTDTNGHPMTQINEFNVVKNPDGSVTVLLFGQAEIAASMSDYEMILSTQTGQSPGQPGQEFKEVQKKQINSPSFAILRDEQLPGWYELMYNDPVFVTDMESLNYSGKKAFNTILKEEGYFDDALNAYYNALASGQLPSRLGGVTTRENIPNTPAPNTTTVTPVSNVSDDDDYTQEMTADGEYRYEF